MNNIVDVQSPDNLIPSCSGIFRKNFAGTTLNYSDEEYFNFTWNGYLGDPIDKILDLKKKTNILKPGVLRLFVSDRDDYEESNLLQALFEVFDHFRKNDIVWEVLEFHFFSCVFRESDKNVLFSANSASCFKRFVFESPVDFRHGGTDLEKESLLSGMTVNDQIEAVDISPARKITNGDMDTLIQLLQKSTTFKELYLCDMGANINNPLLIQAFRDNTTLERVHLDTSDESSDEILANIILSLQDHPTIRDLSIAAGSRPNGGLELTSHALRLILASSSTLSFLRLNSPPCFDSVFNSRQILSGLELTKSLKTIQIKGNYLNGILDGILTCQNSSLETLVYKHWDPEVRFLHGGTIVRRTLRTLNHTIEELERVANMERRKTPIDLELWGLTGQPAMRAIEKILRSQPEIRIITDFIGALDSPHTWNLNWHGQYLLEYYQRNNKGSTVPLSLWPMVFEVANKNENPSVVYEFLTSGAFLESYVSKLQHDFETAATSRRQ